MAVYRVKNTTVSSLQVLGVIIPPQTYYDIEPEELFEWRSSSEVFEYVANGTLVVNRGTDVVDDIDDPLKGWQYLAGESKPPEDEKGRWEIIIGDPKEDSSYEQFVWTIEVLVDSSEVYEEIIEFPASGISLNIEQFIVASPDINYSGKMKIVKVSGQETRMINPLVDPETFYVMKVETYTSAGNTTIPISAKLGVNLNMIPLSSIFSFSSPHIAEQTGYDRIYEKIVDICAQQMFIRTENPIPVNLDTHTKITLVERFLVTVAGNQSTVIAKTDYPFKIRREWFGGEDFRLAVELRNDHPSNAGKIAATIYGFKKLEK